VHREIEEIVPIPSARSIKHSFDVALAGERSWLVRYCVRLVGDLDAAEDLAQETLYSRLYLNFHAQENVRKAGTRKMMVEKRIPRFDGGMAGVGLDQTS